MEVLQVGREELWPVWRELGDGEAVAAHASDITPYGGMCCLRKPAIVGRTADGALEHTWWGLMIMPCVCQLIGWSRTRSHTFPAAEGCDLHAGLLS